MKWIHKHEIPDTPMARDLRIPRGSKITPLDLKVLVSEDSYKPIGVKTTDSIYKTISSRLIWVG